MQKKKNSMLHYSITPLQSFIIAIIIFIFDQFTKYLIKSHVGHYEIIGILPFLNIVYVENIGSAFGMFKVLGNAFFIAIAVFAIIFMSVLIVKYRDNRLSFSLFLGGAAGNLADRIIYGYVIDFIDIYIGKFHWPAFNIADSALTIGFLMLLIKIILPKKIGFSH